MAYYEAFDSGDSTNPRATVYRIAYTPKTQVSLDGAMNGAMNAGMRLVAAAAGDANPQFSSTVTSIDGHPARRASYSGRARGTSVHLDAAFVQSGQKIWEVQVIYTGDSSASDSKRILDSIQINPVR